MNFTIVVSVPMWGEYSVDINALSRVSDVKEAVAEEAGLAVSKFEIEYEGQLLNESQIIVDRLSDPVGVVLDAIITAKQMALIKIGKGDNVSDNDLRNEVLKGDPTLIPHYAVAGVVLRPDILFAAVKEHKHESVREILAAYKPSKDTFKGSPLYYASELGCATCVQMFLPYWDIKRRNQPSALSVARNAEVADVLLAVDGINVNDGSLHRAVSQNRIEVVKRILQHPSISLSMLNCEGRTILSCATSKEMVDLLRENGAKITSSEFFLSNSWAKYRMRFLTIEDIDVDRRSDDGDSAFFYAQDINELQKLASISKDKDWALQYRNDGTTILHLACEKGRSSISDFMLQTLTKELINQRCDMGGFTALSLCVENRSIRDVKEMLKHPFVDPNTQSESGATPLNLAVKLKELSIIDELLRHKNTKIDIPTHSGEYPFHTAVVTGDVSLAGFIYECDPSVDVNSVFGEKSTALLHACINRNVDMVEFLLKLPAMDYNKKVGSYSSLYHACKCDVSDIPMMLLRKPLIELDSSEGAASPLHAACQSRNSAAKEILKIIATRGGDVDEEVECRTPLRNACSSGNIEIMELLLKMNADLAFGVDDDDDGYFDDSDVEKYSTTPLAELCFFSNFTALTMALPFCSNRKALLIAQQDGYSSTEVASLVKQRYEELCAPRSH